MAVNVSCSGSGRYFPIARYRHAEEVIGVASLPGRKWSIAGRNFCPAWSSSREWERGFRPTIAGAERPLRAFPRRSGSTTTASGRAPIYPYGMRVREACFRPGRRRRNRKLSSGWIATGVPPSTRDSEKMVVCADRALEQDGGPPQQHRRGDNHRCRSTAHRLRAPGLHRCRHSMRLVGDLRAIGRKGRTGRPFFFVRDLNGLAAADLLNPDVRIRLVDGCLIRQQFSVTRNCGEDCRAGVSQAGERVHHGFRRLGMPPYPAASRSQKHQRRGQAVYSATAGCDSPWRGCGGSQFPRIGLLLEIFQLDSQIGHVSGNGAPDLSASSA